MKQQVERTKYRFCNLEKESFQHLNNTCDNLFHLCGTKNAKANLEAIGINENIYLQIPEATLLKSASIVGSVLSFDEYLLLASPKWLLIYQDTLWKK